LRVGAAGDADRWLRRLGRHVVGNVGAGLVTFTTAVEAPKPVDGLVATIGTSRLYALQHAFGVGLQNGGDEPVTVRPIQLNSPLYATFNRE
jgi:hypothetical protein